MFEGTTATFTKTIIACKRKEIFLLNSGHMFMSSILGHLIKNRDDWPLGGAITGKKFMKMAINASNH